MSATRRLAAIAVADVVGYSRLMEADETGTFAALRQRKTAILEPVVRAHGGLIVKMMGDGALIEFASAVNAVKAALELQGKFSEANDDLPGDRHIILRIGINLGDVIGEGSDIYCDGVSIAARLESLTEPGGICISNKVHDEIRGKIEASFEDMGEQQLKNIARPVRVFRIGLGEPRNPVVQALPAGRDKLSIAVLPFPNMSGDAEQQYFCDGITEDIITELSRFRQMHVVSRNSSARFRGTDIDMVRVRRELGVNYLLEGSVRRIGKRIRITAQLIDAATGNHVWAERYDNPQEEIFDVQDRVVRTIVGTLSGRMSAAGAESARRKLPSNLAAYDYVLRGDALPWGAALEAEAEARALFNKAIELDPGYARAYALLSFTMAREWLRDTSESTQLRDTLFEVARKAVTLDENDALCQSAMAWAHVYRGSYGLAGQHLARAYALNPNQPSTQADLASFHICLGEPEKAIACLSEAKRLDPYFTPSWYWAELGTAHFIAHRYEDAIAAFRQSAALSSGEQATLAASYALAGKAGEAGDGAADLMRRLPGFSISRFLAKELWRALRIASIWLAACAAPDCPSEGMGSVAATIEPRR
ncbi:adenylate/guanylate cyclase domain-containing protein [soil metagenome]